MLRLRSRPLRALQVEVTSRCTRRCALCPRNTLAASWIEHDLEPTLWQRLMPDLALADHVHLQGWGEPLLHPRLPQMAADAHAARCRVGVTTNGDLLADAAEWITGGDVDLVTVSVAGSATQHSKWRDGSSLDDLLAAVDRVAAGRRNRRRPRLQIAFLLLADNAQDLPEVVRQAARCGCDEVYVIHLDFTPGREQLELAALAAEGATPEVRQAVTDAAAIARRRGISFRPPALEPQELVTCALDPLRFASIAADGCVGPCIYLSMPVAGSIPRCTAEKEVKVERLCFASLRQAGTSLAGILAGTERRRFTTCFERRVAASRDFNEQIMLLRPGVQALRLLDQADAQLEEVLDANPFPARCDGCHKRLGW